jgi:hypothetical protein
MFSQEYYRAELQVIFGEVLAQKKYSFRNKGENSKVKKLEDSNVWDYALSISLIFNHFPCICSTYK